MTILSALQMVAKTVVVRQVGKFLFQKMKLQSCSFVAMTRLQKTKILLNVKTNFASSFWIKVVHILKMVFATLCLKKAMTFCLMFAKIFHEILIRQNLIWKCDWVLLVKKFVGFCLNKKSLSLKRKITTIWWLKQTIKILKPDNK